MTSLEPTYLSQGVSYLGFLSQQLGDLRGIASLTHELIQNADDAKDDSGKLSATRIGFDIRDDALVVSNDSSFREIDFQRIREVASGSKRSESGDRTTGAFGIGFISVYQVTDTPEIHSAGRRWIIRPNKAFDERIEEWKDPSITQDRGTLFKLPWAFQESRVRQELKAPTVTRESIESFMEELSQSFPRAVLFLKKLESLELFRNGNLVVQVKRKAEAGYIRVYCNNDCQRLRVLEGDFSAESWSLKNRFGPIDDNRSAHVRLALPDSPTDKGLLFAALPTELSTGLPFHIDADFFPSADRKSIVFGDSLDPRSEWNRAAIREAASLVETNLVPIRDTFGNDASKFWALLTRLYEVRRENGNDQRMPLRVFWESLTPSLGNVPIVYSECGKWLTPAKTCIPSMREERAVPAFKALGINIVQRNLWMYRNVLTTVGVRRLAVEDIAEALKNRGLIDRPQTVPSDFQVELLWQGIHGVLDNTGSQLAKDRAENLLRECTLAPGIDGRMWACRSAFQSNCHTRQIFASLLPSDVTFLAREDVSLLQQLCPPFTPRDAIDVLECLESEELRARWRRGEFDPTKLLHWFDHNKSKLTEDLRERLAKLPIFPSVKNLYPLEELWLPGGFDDPMGVADLLNMSALERLSDFLQSLGAKKRTFEEYAIRYIAGAFANDGAESIETKRKHLENLERHIGEIKDNQELRKKLAVTNIVECKDRVFRQPGRVYFPCEEVKEVLGDHAHYASLPQLSEGRRDLYRWLGVKTRPRVKDMLRIIESQTRKSPDPETRATVVRMLVAIGKAWAGLDDNEKARCSRLQTKEWLPAERDTSKWYRPDRLAAAYNKSLFASQARFIDVPFRIQQSINEFMRHLRVRLSPQPRQVVTHLLRCSEHNQEPPRDVYRWLNENAEVSDIEPLKKVACLWNGDRYLRPDQAFWGSHSFGGFRVQLGPDLRSYQRLLKALDISQNPDFNDAIEVLKDVSKEVGKNRLQSEDKGVVFRCWVMLSEALQEDALDPENLRNKLRDTKSIPNDDGKLYPPSWMFFEDRPGLADKFPDQLKGNCISRTERVWTAMAAAGVRPISKVVTGDMDDPVNPIEDEEIEKRIIQRATLIRTIMGTAINRRQPDVEVALLDNIRFFHVDELKVSWRLDALRGKWSTPLEPVKAYFNSGEEAIYFSALRNRDYPWSAIARELTFAVAPDEDIGYVVPGLKDVLEAPTCENAIAQVQEWGIAPVQELENLSDRGEIIDTLDDGLAAENGQDQLNSLGNGSVSPPSPDREKQDEPEPFAKKLYEAQTIDSPRADSRQVSFPIGGPWTIESARSHTEESIRIGRSGSNASKRITRWEPTEAANELADNFRSMVHGDYGKRCQICSKSFTTSGGQLQVYVVHVVPPSEDRRTNHLGDLLGLCGWHYSLVRYGEWALLDPGTNSPFENATTHEGWERMRAFISSASRDTDTEGNSYIGLPVRFWNVYQKWYSEPAIVDEQIRYCIPHWTYLCELLKT